MLIQEMILGHSVMVKDLLKEIKVYLFSQVSGSFLIRMLPLILLQDHLYEPL